MEVRKVGAPMRLSEEMIYETLRFEDSRFERKYHENSTPPTPEDWEAYERAKEAFEVLEGYEWMVWGGPDYGTEVLPPQNHYAIVWDETHEEWLERCRKLAHPE